MDREKISKAAAVLLLADAISPIDYNGDGTYEICGYQRIIGSCNADTISEVESLWKYENGKWKISTLQYSTFLIK